MGVWRLACIFLLALSAAAQSAPPRAPKNPGIVEPLTPSKLRRMGRNRHLVLRFNRLATATQLKQLRDQGAKVVQYIPDFGYVVSVPDTFSLEGIDVDSARAPTAAKKVSAQLALVSADTLFAVVEFYPDVDMDVARTIVSLAGLQVHESTEMLPRHLLVEGTFDQLAVLAAWDEVSYLFPASDALVKGSPLNTCAGALSTQGQIGQQIGQIIATTTSWGGPGLTGANLTFSFQNITDKVSSDLAKTEILRAFAEWAKYAKLTFSPGSDPASNRMITVLFGTKAHGDEYPFDGPGGVLAHTFYPYPANPEPIAGDMHFDADEGWAIGSAVDIYSVALHEAGHALGLGHSDQPNAVMYPYYKSATTLTQEDIGAILTLYAAQSTGPAPLTLTLVPPAATTATSILTLSGTTAGGTSPVAVTWSANGFKGNATGSSTWTISAIPLNNGINAITVTATDKQATTVSQTITITRQQSTQTPDPPVITITSPATGGVYSSTSATITLAGTASDTTGIAQVSWSSSSGSTGVAKGTSSWSTGALTLASGTTTVSVVATSTAGTRASQDLQISYTAPTAPSTPPPTAPTPTAPTPAPTAPTPSGSAPPSITISSPTTTTLSTSSSSLAMSGISSGTVTIVNWSTSNGDTGVAKGTNTWSIPAVPLLLGTTTITVQCQNSAGLTAWRSVVVTRR